MGDDEVLPYPRRTQLPPLGMGIGKQVEYSLPLGLWPLGSREWTTLDHPR